jgi:hypothetical protein
MLLPRESDMVASGSEMPLPVPKTKIAEDEGRKKINKRRWQGQVGEDGRASGKSAGKPPRRARATAYCIDGGRGSATERCCRERRF